MTWYVNDFKRNRFRTINIHNPPGLREEMFDETQVAAGETDYGSERLDAFQTVWFECDTEIRCLPYRGQSLLYSRKGLNSCTKPMRE